MLLGRVVEAAGELERTLERNPEFLPAQVLQNELSEFEETDTGLWQGIDDPEKAIVAKAFWTFRAAVTHYFQELTAEIDEALDEVANLCGVQISFTDLNEDMKRTVFDEVVSGVLAEKAKTV